MMQVKIFIYEWKVKNNKSRFFMSLGVLFLLFALVGVFLPIIPQVPFAIISAYFFSKGSARIHLWMRHNKFFGTPVREWEDFKVIRPKMKMIAVVSMVVGAVLGHYKLAPNLAYSLDVVFLFSIAFVLTRKSRIFTFLG